MPRFMVCHTVQGITLEALQQTSAAAQQDPVVKGIASWSNLSKGVLHCVFDAPEEETLAAWFKKMQMPYDRITLVEVEGDHNGMRDLRAAGRAS